MNKPAAQHRWKDSDGLGGGLLVDFMPHLVDQALCLFGVPDRAYADIATQRIDAIGADYATVTLVYGQKRVLLSTDCFSANPRWRFRLAGIAAEYVCTGSDGQEAQLRAGVSPSAPEFGAQSAGRISRLVPMSGDATAIDLDPGNYRGFYEQLKLAIMEGLPVPVPIPEAEKVVAIVDALRRERSWTGD